MRYARNGSPEIFAATTSGLIDSDFGENPAASMQGRYVRNLSLNHMLSFAILSTLGAGVVFGFDGSVLDQIILIADKLSKSHGVPFADSWLDTISIGWNPSLLQY
jgi:hypothetical protein